MGELRSEKLKVKNMGGVAAAASGSMPSIRPFLAFRFSFYLNVSVMRRMGDLRSEKLKVKNMGDGCGRQRKFTKYPAVFSL